MKISAALATLIVRTGKEDAQSATTGGDPAAWADSIREVEAFFGRHL